MSELDLGHIVGELKMSHQLGVHNDDIFELAVGVIEALQKDKAELVKFAQHSYERHGERSLEVDKILARHTPLLKESENERM